MILSKIQALAEIFFLLIVLTSLWGGLVYRLFRLDLAGVTIVLVLVAASFIILHKLRIKYNENGQPALSEPDEPRTALAPVFEEILALGYLALFLTGLKMLLAGGTTGSIISPWQVLPAYFFGLYFFASLILLYLAAKSSRFGFFFSVMHFFWSFSVIVSIYRLGFGYDYFVHQATLELIGKQGFVEPKQFYYLGYYGLLATINKLLPFGFAGLQKFLVPILAAVFLPFGLKRAFSAWFGKNFSPACLPLMLAVPFSLFTFSTPQNFAFLLLVLLVLRGLAIKNFYDWTVASLLSLAILFIHPLAGLPTILFAAMLAVRRGYLRFVNEKIAYAAVFAVASLSLPLSFYFFEKGAAGAAPGLVLDGGLDLPGLVIPGRENFILNFVYFYAFNLFYIFLFLAAAGLAGVLKNKEEFKKLSPYALLAAGLGVAAGLTGFLPFNFLINYERGDFAARVLTAALIFLLPFVMLWFARFIRRLSAEDRFVRASFLVFAAALMTASLYVSYPRFDRYFNSRGYSTGAADLEAVDRIEADAAGEDYIVLANQQVSAAALLRSGFSRYYNGVFYYPVPTSGPLYQYYLKMVYEKPSRETMARAMALAGVRQGYFVLNKYWFAFPKVLEEAKLEANSFEKIGGGELYFFKFTR